jgi:hypothetical protein
MLRSIRPKRATLPVPITASPRSSGDPGTGRFQPSPEKSRAKTGRALNQEQGPKYREGQLTARGTTEGTRSIWG